MTEEEWLPLGTDITTVLRQCQEPLLALSRAQVPAILLRQVYDRRQCRALTARFIERGLMRDPAQTAQLNNRLPVQLRVVAALGVALARSMSSAKATA